MAITGVLRPGHVCIRVLELEPAIRHYRDVMGLHEMARDRAADGRARVYFKAWDEADHHSVVLVESDASGMECMGWKVDGDATLRRLSEAVCASGLATDTRWIAAGEQLATGERFRFTVPTGHVMELYAHRDVVGCATGNLNPEPWPDGMVGMAPSRFDHCLLYGNDLDGSIKLFTEVLGFGIAEEIVAGPDELRIGAFLSCSNKAHDVAFIRQPVEGKLHHVSFALESWAEVLRAADLISKNKVSLDIGPTRHGITRGTTVYFFDPSGNRNEVFSGGYQWYPDRPVIKWTEDELGTGIFYHDRKLNEAFLSVVT